ncbi:CLUMA_CG012712, isoform A [Clunio marinus]|uniref:CLUMA_CG012712, isoform A n=1 Tax=Clunio marinus TaxID=568069 RepID=A0A1J1IG92_9DIPT|nr:CLUMA_CG012712, isoform A [Clunio marinus]
MKAKSFRIFVFLIVPYILKSVYANEDNEKKKQINNYPNNEDLNYLSELPINKLLKLMKSLMDIKRKNVSNNFYNAYESEDELENRIINESRNNSLITTSEFLHQHDKKFDRYDAIEIPWEKQSKIQSFFQLSVTAMGFLAFAGYLLCMIVQAIKSKGTMYMYPSTMSVANGAATVNALIKKSSAPLRKRRPIGLVTLLYHTFDLDSV